MYNIRDLGDIVYFNHVIKFHREIKPYLPSLNSSATVVAFFRHQNTVVSITDRLLFYLASMVGSRQ